MSVQKVLALDAPSFRQGNGLLAGVTALLADLRSRLAAEQALRHAARSRAEVMSLARRYASTQPEFAKDLYAAAGCDFQV